MAVNASQCETSSAMKFSKVMRIFGYTASKLAAIPMLLYDAMKSWKCNEQDILFWDDLSLMDYAVCDSSGLACDSVFAGEIDARTFLGIVCLVLLEMAYIWLMYKEFKSPPPIEKQPNHADEASSSGVTVEWIEGNPHSRASTSEYITIDL
ncbi:uncharacterized protein LOC125651830 [Ostrea edulis]|uniref:uncharacterized protein LOC125651830 n=1 Tax=Ostrea edulis TaxID=37623 RepID=UPI0020945397|nr:uncharacterized protein LOC125651830 [Ostrea edulis]